jgi:hypothetical protein
MKNATVKTGRTDRGNSDKSSEKTALKGEFPGYSGWHE